MAIQVTCGSCSSKFNAPDAAAGKQAKCPKCGNAIKIPTPAPKPIDDDILEAEEVVPRPFSDEGFDDPVPVVDENDDRKPCPMCGEMIQRNAIKCRHCGEIFDPLLRAQQQKTTKAKSDEGSTPILLFVTSLLGCFSPILAVYGIVYLNNRPYQFKYKGLAIAGTVLHCIWTLLLVLRVVMAVVAAK